MAGKYRTKAPRPPSRKRKPSARPVPPQARAGSGDGVSYGRAVVRRVCGHVARRLAAQRGQPGRPCSAASRSGQCVTPHPSRPRSVGRSDAFSG